MRRDRAAMSRSCAGDDSANLQPSSQGAGGDPYVFSANHLTYDRQLPRPVCLGNS